MRGYVTGSLGLFIDPFIASTDWYRRLGMDRVKEAWDGAWYQTTRGLRRVAEIPEQLFTPSTKADQGNHDQNISSEEGASFLSLFDAHLITITTVAAHSQISTTALSLYKTVSS